MGMREEKIFVGSQQFPALGLFLWLFGGGSSRLQKSLSLYTLFILCIVSLLTQQLLFWAPHFPIVFSRWTFLYRKTPGMLSPAIWNMT